MKRGCKVFSDAQEMINVLMYYLQGKKFYIKCKSVIFSVVIHLKIALNIKSSQENTNMKNSVSDVSFIIHEYDKVKHSLCT